MTADANQVTNEQTSAEHGEAVSVESLGAEYPKDNAGEQGRNK